VWGVGDRHAVEVLPEIEGVRAMWASFRKGDLQVGGYQLAGAPWVTGSTPTDLPGLAYGRVSRLWTLASLADSPTLRRLRRNPSAPTVRGRIACIHQLGVTSTELCVRKDGAVTEVRHGTDTISLQGAVRGYHGLSLTAPPQQ
jgi:hypothetical protein